MDEELLALFERLVISFERLADAAESSSADNEERWFPENYNHEENSDE